MNETWITPVASRSDDENRLERVVMYVAVIRCAMLRALVLSLAMLFLILLGRASAQDDPVLGNWRGTLTFTQGEESPIVITVIKKGDGYAGSTTGLGATAEISLNRVRVSGNRISIEAVAESKLGDVVLESDLSAEGNTLKGVGTVSVGAQRFPVTLQLLRRTRRDVVQPQVEQRIDYFVGRWKFEYLGGEFPPLSAGSRTGIVTFSRAGASNFVRGRVEGEAAGKQYQENLTVGFDPDTQTLVFFERRFDGVELVSLGNWRSPLAIRFYTSPVEENGRTYQLRRVISVTSESAFEVTEEFSIDAGPYRRLGNASFARVE